MPAALPRPKPATIIEIGSIPLEVDEPAQREATQAALPAALRGWQRRQMPTAA